MPDDNHENRLLQILKEHEKIYETPQVDHFIRGFSGMDPDRRALTTEEVITLVEEHGTGGARTMSVTIPATGWTEDANDTTGYPWILTLTVESVKESEIPILTFAEGSLPTAETCGFCPNVRTLEGALALRSETPPAAAMSATLTLIQNAISSGTGFEVATQEELHEMFHQTWNE